MNVMIQELNPSWREEFEGFKSSHLQLPSLFMFNNYNYPTQFGVLIVMVYFLHIFGLAYQGKDIVIRFIIEYSSLRDFSP
jgi:hypothetical protein